MKIVKKSQKEKVQWFKHAKLGMFVHWGLYSILGRGEWVLKRDNIPPEEYAGLARQWEPRSFNPESWCLLAQKAGMKYVVFTTLHHDGFALFDTKTDTFNSINTPANGDFVAEFVKACRKYDLGVGLYYSLMDWRFIDNGRDAVSESEKMKKLAYAQIRELMSNYGKIDILWYDGTCCPLIASPSRKDIAAFWEAEKLNGFVRELQPDILINDRSGIDADFCTIEGRNIIRPPDGAEVWEACMTLGDDDFSYWGYCHSAIHRRTSPQALLLLLHTLEFGGNFLLNVSPDPDGIIPAWQQKIFEAVGSWVNANQEAVYGVEPTNVARATPKSHQGNSCGFFTAKGDVLYFYLYEWPGCETRIPLLNKKISSVKVLKTKQSLPFHRDKTGALIISGLPRNPIDPLCTVLELT